MLGLAQTYITIVDTNKQAIQGAIVSMQNLSGAGQFTYISSDEKGRAILDNQTIPFLLQVRSLSYDKYTAKIYKPSDLKDSIILVQSAIPIEEAIVDMNKGFASIRNDTVHYNLEALNLKDNDNLKEILSRIPGFRVDDNYKITHAGQEVNKLLVNGKEAFEYQNKMALDHIESGMLAGLSVINDYKDPFKINLDQSKVEKVINLALKDDFTNIIKGNIEVLGGYKNKFKVKPFLFYFSEHISVFTVNNFNNMYDKDWSSEDYYGTIRSYNMGSRYYQGENRRPFYVKDITLNKERSYLNSTTLKKYSEKYALQAVLNYTNLSAVKYFETDARYIGNPFYFKSNSDSLKARMFSYMVNYKQKIFKSSILQFISSNYADKHFNDKRFKASYSQEETSFFVNENTNQQTAIFSNSLELDSKLANKLSWSNNWTWKTENSVDLWNIKHIEGVSTNNNPYRRQDINLKNSEHSLKSTFDYSITKLINAKFTVENFKASDRIDFSSILFKRNRLKSDLDLAIKSKHLNLLLSVSYNNLRRSLTDVAKQSNYGTGYFNADIFLDNYKRNKIRLNFEKSIFLASLKSGISFNVQSYDQVILGQRALLFDLFDQRSSKISYIYDFPFKGQSFQFALFANTSANTIIQTIDLTNNLYWSYENVKGLHRTGAEVFYSHNLFKKFYPIKLDLSYQLSRNKHFQLQLGRALPIKQDAHNFQAALNSYSKSRVNFLMKMFSEFTTLDYEGENRRTQINYSLLFGARYDYKNFGVKPVVKYNLVTDRLIRNSFLDLNINANYTLNKNIELILASENFLQNMGFKAAAPLGLIHNQGGFTYFQSYQNLVGYCSVGLKYRF